MKRIIVWMIVALVGSLISGIPVFAGTLFEDSFSAGMDNWEIVDPGEVDVINDNSAPAGYGPKVLFMTEAGSGIWKWLSGGT
jgi:hypothetical protein